MPSSTWVHTTLVCDIVKKLNPKTILDIGVGYGRWGFLFRELLDIFKGRYYKEFWETKIYGVEIFPDYLVHCQEYFYNRIYKLGIKEFLSLSVHTKMSENIDFKYDVIIAGDVIEHLEKKEAIETIKKLTEISKNLIVCIPIGKKYPQGKVLENINETHLSTWEYEEFSTMKNFKHCHKLTEKIKNRPYAVVVFENKGIK